MLLLWYGAYKVFADTVHVPVLAAISTGLVVMFGYFATHHLALMREQKERKFKQFVNLIKSMRFFLLEKNIGGTEQQFKMRDELQDAYFEFSLLTSAKSYEALSIMMDSFKDFLKDQNNSEKLNKFRKSQSDFVNELRREFFVDKEISFKTYDFQLEEKITR